MAADVTIVEGAAGLHDFFLTENGAALNITGATSPLLKVDGYPDRALAIISGAGGQLRYTRVAGDYQRGLKKARIWLTMPGDSLPSASNDFTFEIEAPFP